MTPEPTPTKPKLVTKKVEVRQTVSVTVDEAKFTPEFMAEFRASFYNFDTLDEHIEHLGQLFARGLVPWFTPDYFIEGYGPMNEMGITFSDNMDSIETEVIPWAVPIRPPPSR